MLDFAVSRFSDLGPLTVLWTVLGLFCIYAGCLIHEIIWGKEG